MGKSVNSIEKELGTPDRVDPSLYGYEWWIYNKSLANYIQVGVEKGRVVTVFATGPKVEIPPFKIGQAVEDIYASNQIETNVDLNYQNSDYRFELTEDDMNTRPLIKVGKFFVQLYIDKFTGSLSSVRFLNAPTLIKQRPYELVYRGDLIETPPVSKDLEAQIEDGNEKQIFDLTNVIRLRHKKPVLKWDEKTAEVAYEHSKDMYDTKTFSHTSEKYGELSDRLKAGEVFYQLAGENIAAQYTDAPAVVEGWLNSKGHRESLLNGKFTHIGVGVYKKHYTQNFIEKWEQ